MSSLEDFLFISFEQKNEMKKGKYMMDFKYILFCSSIDLFDAEDFKKNSTDGNLIRKCVDVAVFMVRGISLVQSF